MLLVGVIALVSCGVGLPEEGERTDGSAKESTEEALLLEAGHPLSDDGYEGAAVGSTIAELKVLYPSTRFEPEQISGQCEIIRASSVGDLEITADGGRIVRVDVVGRSIASITGGHRVGDRVATVAERYKQRIAAGESLSMDDSKPDRIVVSARNGYRLVFEASSEGLVNRMYGALPDRLGAERCTGSPVAPPAFELAGFVPPRLANADLQLRDPSLEKVFGSQPLLELAWGEVTSKWKTLAVVDVVDKSVGCVYEAGAGAIGIYAGTEPALRSVIVAVLKPDQLTSVAFAACVLRKAPDVLLSLSFEPKLCAAGYRTDPSTGTFLVTYAVAGQFLAGVDPCSDVCKELPGCTDAKQE